MSKKKAKREQTPQGSSLSSGELRSTGGRFAKGRSGNPGGVSKEKKEIRDLARLHGPECIERLLTFVRSDEIPPSVCLDACIALLDRGFGKPSIAVRHSGEMTVKEEAVVLVHTAPPKSDA